MITWTQQGAALVGAIELIDGRHAKVALVGPRSNPKGAAIIVKAAEKASVDTIVLPQALDAISPAQAVEIICMQERAHGASGLPSPMESTESP